MIEVYTSITLGIIIGWIAFRLGRFATGRLIGYLFGIAAGIYCVIVARDSLPILYFTAIFSPIAVTIPLLAIRNTFAIFTFPWPRFSKSEVTLFLVLYIIFLSASMGVFTFDPYRFGYDPVIAGGVALALVIYGTIRRNPFFAIVAVSGQILWVFEIGSSNYFDHITHVLLIPISLVYVLRRSNGSSGG